MKAYKFKNDYEKNIFYSYFSEKRSDVDIFDLSKCVGVRMTLLGDLHLMKDLDYNSIELIGTLDELIFMCN